MKRALLLTMPFSATKRPAIGISLLKAALYRYGLPCDVRYLNFNFAKRIGIDHYERVCCFTSDAMLGEYIFAADVFGEGTLQPDAYTTEILCPAIRNVPGDSATGAKPEESANEILSWVLLLAEHARRFLDECMVSISWNEYALVGFTTTFQQTMASLALAKRIKSQYPHITIVFGGANCEAEMGVALHRLFPVIDCVCSGEGDISFPVLAGHILHGHPLGDVPGIIRRVGRETILPTISTAPVEMIDTLPIPDYEDYVAQRADVLGLDDPPQILIETARGCWWGEKHHCTFCGLNGVTMQFRAKSPSRALTEISSLVQRYGARKIAAVDNIIDMKYFQHLLPQLASLNLDVELFYETKANLRRSQIRQLREAGVVRIQPGIESLSSNVLRLMRKGVTVIQNIQLLRWCAEYMVEAHWNFLAGFPGEMPEDYARQTEIIPLLFHLRPPDEFTTLRLDRFSPLFVRAEEHGLKRVRPRPAYKYIFPFPEEQIFDLAYYFDFDYIDGRPPGIYVRDVSESVREWTTMHNESRLLSLIYEDALVIWDTRPIAVRREHRLFGLDRHVYEYCDQARTRAALEAHLTSTNGATSPGQSLERVLAHLVDAKLLLHEDDRWLSLAVAGDYQIEFLARHLALGRPIPANTSQALKRLYELEPRVVAAVVEERVRECREECAVGESTKTLS